MNEAASRLKKTFNFILAGLLLLVVSSTVVPVQAQLEPAVSEASFWNPSSASLQDPLPEVTVDDTDLTYTGNWYHLTGQTGCYDNTMSTSNTSETSATYTFTGSAITLYSKTWNNRGMMDVFLDDILVATVDLYTSNAVTQNPVYSTSFPYGQHTIKVAWTGTKNTKSSGTTITLDKLSYGSDPFTVDDAAFTYAGTWANRTGQTGNYNNTMSDAGTSGAYATYTFTGSAVTVYSKTGYNRGEMAIYLDDNLLSTVDLYSPNLVFQVPVFTTTFPYGQHTIKMEWTGTKNPSSSGTAIVLDKLTYLGNAPTPSPTITLTATLTPTNTPTLTPTPTFTSTATTTFTPTKTPTSTATSTPTMTPTPNSNGSGICWRSGPSWPDYTVYYDIVTSPRPSNILEADWIVAIEAAAQTWNNVTPSHFNFVRQVDSSNTISYEQPDDPDWLAGTAAWPEPYYQHARTRINPLKAPYDTNSPPAAGAISVQNLQTHEFGHWLYLDDLDINSGCADAMMFYSVARGSGYKLNLSNFDINGINYQYP